MSAQLEDGYTKLANELLEEVPKFKFNGTQLRIIMLVWRYTYGFNRKDHEMSLTFISNAAGIIKSQIDRELTKLIENKVIIVTAESTHTKSRKLGFNKNYSEWDIEYSHLKRVQSSKKMTVIGLDGGQSSKKSTPPVIGLDDQEIKVLNKDLNKLEDDVIGESDLIKMSTEVENHFCLRRGKGLQVNVEDFKLMKEVVAYHIPIDFIKTVIDCTFAEFKPKHPKDTIKSFSYISPICFDRWTMHLEKIKPFPKGGQASVEKHKGSSQGFRYGGSQAQGKGEFREGELTAGANRRIEQRNANGELEFDQEFLDSLPI